MTVQVTTPFYTMPPNVTSLPNISMCPENVTMDSTYHGLVASAHAIRHFYIWIIFAFGFPGNILSVIVIIKMSRQPHQHVTSLFFVGLLAVVDNITIVLKLVENQSQNKRFLMNGLACKLLFFFGLTFANYANWILISLALERYIAVRYPLKLTVLWSLRKAIVVISIVLVFMCCVHFHLWWTVTSSSDGFTCRLTLTGHASQAWFYISSFLYAILPACFLTLGNILIIILLRRVSNTRQSLSEDQRNRGDKKDFKKQDRQITAMLLAVAAVFVVLSFPRSVFLVAYPYWVTESCTFGDALKTFLNVLTTNIADTNHAVNFYLYFLAGKRFRNAYACTALSRKHVSKRISKTTF